ncbi:hypothetical protein FACS1894158_01770 [Betaproteobacteria bacterium]|nr:hypothetical protein FACS1894158_01770 [Betaproteobacteria bacterium]
MTIREQLIKDISILPESALHTVREFVLFEIGRKGASIPTDSTAMVYAGKKKEAYEILKQFKGSLPADFDYKNKLMEVGLSEAMSNAAINESSQCCGSLRSPQPICSAFSPE